MVRCDVSLGLLWIEFQFEPLVAQLALRYLEAPFAGCSIIGEPSGNFVIGNSFHRVAAIGPLNDGGLNVWLADC